MDSLLYEVTVLYPETYYPNLDPLVEALAALAGGTLGDSGLGLGLRDISVLFLFPSQAHDFAQLCRWHSLPVRHKLGPPPSPDNWRSVIEFDFSIQEER